jgi:hypothetical protein
MDIYGIEALLGLPDFHVVNQVIRSKRLDLHLERRDNAIVCPHCQTCCSRVLASRPLGAFVTCLSWSVRLCCGCICDALRVRHVIIDPGKRVRPSVHA